jgi:hypothetical protein
MYASSFAQQLSVIGAGPLPAMDLPPERLARIATRRAFVEMKRRFMQAVERIQGQPGEDLRERVRRTQQPNELWSLRAAVLIALSINDQASQPI